MYTKKTKRTSGARSRKSAKKNEKEIETSPEVEVMEVDDTAQETKNSSEDKSIAFQKEIEVLRKKILDPNKTLRVASENGNLLIAALDGLRSENNNIEMTIALSKLVWSYSVVRRFAEDYFKNSGSPLKSIDQQLNQLSLEEPSRKKLKQSSPLKKDAKLQSNSINEDLLSLLKAMLLLLKRLPIDILASWSPMEFLKFKASNDLRIKWYSLNCLAILLKLAETETQQLIRSWKINSKDDLMLSLEFQQEIEKLENNLIVNVEEPYKYDEEIKVVDEENRLVSIGGLIVKSVHSSKSAVTKSNSDKVVLFPSFVQRLKDIALNVTNDLPVCIIGPIGSGKSSLIRHVASVFGRNEYPEFISVQMSDQIDSRLLLGSYHSTDLPGQFIWKPGCLTKAVLNGHWIVFEDLDCAPMDVITLLDGFIDNHSLSVPGYGEVDYIHPDFRMFSTCRNQNFKLGRSYNKIGKSWQKIFVSSYDPEEMKSIVKSRSPHLRPIVDRLVEAFESLMVLAKDRKTEFSSTRPLSVRDFLKFCQRIPKEMDFTQVSTAIAIFQEGLDLFVSSLHKPGLKEIVAEVLGTHLNLLKAKAEYYVSMYKPHVVICSKNSALSCGRFSLPLYKELTSLKRIDAGVYSLTKRTCCMLETISGAIKHQEPVLLIGETGVGKTSCVQYLANVLHQKLVVVNLNRQSDSADLLGGYKPVELKYVFLPLREEFETLFEETFSKEANSKYLNHIMTCYANKRWKDLVQLMKHVEKSAIVRCRRISKDDLLQRWTILTRKLSRVEAQMLEGEESPFAFSFIEGTLISAIRNGYWILLDEINLATSEMLQCLSGVLDENAQIHLWEKGDEQPIQRHKNFHLFAAMNPSTDVGKKDLPLGIRNRFSELYVDELVDADELRVLVADYLKELLISSGQIESIVQFYLKIKNLSQSTLVDGLGKKPHFSLRTLCRALKISAMNLYGSVSRSLYESFCLSFLTQLDFASHPIVESLIAKHIFGKTEVKSIMNQPLPPPSSFQAVKVEGYWVPQGDLPPNASGKYILTASVKRNLRDIARIVSAGKLPILIQGETSVGKTSLVQYLADCSGNRCYRINNHQHTDLQEYIGSYQSDSKGKLVFTEGVLVQAMKRGEWIILDELNLAPSEVLEALNRLLDDNRQLFITETGVTVTAHPRFMLFATQNPPGLYGGRKILSRAFRNRFVELHFDEIPSAELENILHLRCEIPVSYCKKVIGVMKDLQLRRKASAALQGKHGFATLRDLFRWAERYRLSGEQKTTFYDWDQHLADEGYLVLSGKERKPAEAEVIRSVLEKNFKRKIDTNNLFSLHDKTSPVTRDILEIVLNTKSQEFEHIVWTSQLRRLAVLIGNAMKFKEPVLLVGETGCGKTTIVQLLSYLRGRDLYTINCHMNSEGSDFLGGLRPVRDHSDQNGRLFEWVNGPLVEAMEYGGIFLCDEISLADDSVLERLNSVLEPERTLLIAERGEEIPRMIVAEENFHFIGTMNPGGDYGKKELSPALRNRLTEIWCDSTTEEEDLVAIIEHNLVSQIKGQNVGSIMTNFVRWLQNNELTQKCTISIRDYLSWTHFINHMTSSSVLENRISLSEAMVHGACLAFLDGLGTGNTSSDNRDLSEKVQKNATEYLINIISDKTQETLTQDYRLAQNNRGLQVGPFVIYNNPLGDFCKNPSKFALESPTTLSNIMRILRAMQLRKPILLEGSPGVGKTALVTALASITGNSLTRINLSEQTDISDLFGADLPVEGKEGGHFEWRDGPLLQALKNNSWILLDELNLASQSVLEGLNACLDHRGCVFIPELNKTFRISQSEETSSFSRIFGCQNPVRQGGARKGLPKSFLNRFTQVYINSLSIEDFDFVLQSSFPMLSTVKIHAMSEFASKLHEQVCQRGLFGAKGSPWDMNLRDLMRWAQLTVNSVVRNNMGIEEEDLPPEAYVDLIYGLRMRSVDDRNKVLKLFCQVYNELVPNKNIDKSALEWGQSEMTLLEDRIVCGQAVLKRVDCPTESSGTQILSLQKDLPQLEALMTCLNIGWMPILVGPAGSSKTSIVKLVSQLAGRKLQIIHPSPDMDTIELLGGFEQADIYRRVDEIHKDLDGILLKMVKNQLSLDAINQDSAAHDILGLWTSFKQQPHLSPEEGLGHDEEIKRIQSTIDFLQTAYLKCKSFSESESHNLEMLQYQGGEVETPREGRRIHEKAREHEQLERVSKELEQICTHLKSGIQTGAFQWIDSRLIKALVTGEWVLIDGANRCSAAVLDRLNSLVEPNGSILLSERGSIDGKILEIKPNPEFRLILALDPIYGEISRAMRNRGVEIYMSSSDKDVSRESTTATTTPMMTYDPVDNHRGVGTALGWTNEEDITLPLREFGINFFDLNSLLRGEGLKDPLLRNAIVNLHREIRDTVASAADFTDENYQLLQIVSSTKSIVLQLQQGISFREAVRRSLVHAYSNLGTLEVNFSALVEKVVTGMTTKRKELLLGGELLDQTTKKKTSWGQSMLAVSLPNFINSQMYRVWKHLEVLEGCMSQLSFLMDNQCERRFSKELVEDFLILSVFSRVVKQDAHALSMAVGLRYPLKASFVCKLANVLDSLEFESFVDWKQQSWDIQELYPRVIAKFSGSSSSVNEKEKKEELFKILQISLSLHFQNKIFHGDSSLENPKKGTLGFVVKNVKFADAGNMSEFLHCFWTLVIKFNSIFEFALKEQRSFSKCEEGKENLVVEEEYAKLWLDGMKISLWGKRLGEVAEKKCSTKLPDEKLMANINLLLQWISEHVVQRLGDIGGTASKNQMRLLVDNCFKTVDHCRDRLLLQRNKIFRDMNKFSPFINTENAIAAQPLFEILSTVWSYNDSTGADKLLNFLTSANCKDLHATLCNVSQKFLSNQSVIGGEEEQLQNWSESLKSLIESVGGDDSESVFSDSKDNLLALKEFLKITESGSKENSTFVNPFVLSYRKVRDEEDTLTPLFKYLEVERFRQTFVKFPVGTLQNACLLPVFAGRIIINVQNVSYKIPSLESNGIVESCQKKLLSCLTAEMTKPYEMQKVTTSSLSNLAEYFISVVESWKIVFFDSPMHITQFENAKVELELLKSRCLDPLEYNNRYVLMVGLGAIMIATSSFMLEVSSYLPAVDPVVENEVLGQYLEEEINVFESWITSKRFHLLASTGRDILDQNIDSSAIHPYIGHVVGDIVSSREKLAEARASLVPRPEPPMYAMILQDIKQFVGTIASFSKIQELTSAAVRLIENKNNNSPDDINSILIQCVNWLDCHKNFVKKISRHYLYWDITAGFLTASVQASAGFNLLVDGIRRMYLASSQKAKNSIMSMVSFPMPHEESIRSVSGLYKDEWAYQRANKRVFLASLISFSNKLKIHQRLSSEAVLQLHKYCVDFTEWWKDQELEKQKKQEDEDAMYIFKGKEKAMEKTDEEQEEFDLMNMFPSFEEDFKDLEKVEVLEDGFNSEKPIENKIIDCGELTSEDVQVFFDVHTSAVSHVCNRWMAKKDLPNSKVDFVTPFMNIFEVGCFGFTEGSFINSFDREDEREFIIGANVAAHQLSSESKLAKWDPANYDFYHDSNVLEAQKLQGVFTVLKEKIVNLLAEWPDHPALQQIIKILQRIESFRLDSPLMKFLTGLELLLGTCQEWESVASKRVSIAEQLSEITNLIICWRKLELRFWKNLSEQCFKREKAEARKWWFNLFSVIMEMVSGANESEESPESILKLFHQFMESSSLGQFSTRLLIMENLLRHITLLESYGLVQLKPYLQPYMWNTISYYRTFEELVSTKLNSLKEPIEKKIKDFVKISRWNDANFYSLTDSVKKAQKMLNKLMSEYSKVLKTPVGSVLLADVGTEVNKKSKYQLPKLKVDKYVLSVEALQNFNPSEEIIQNFSSHEKRRNRFRKIPKLYNKSREISVESFNNCGLSCRSQVLDVDELTGNIIEKVHTLQNLPIPDKGPQRKKALHNIHNVRRTNLADLFKTLQASGLSYKRGMIQIQKCGTTTGVPYNFLIEPMDISAGWNHFVLDKHKIAEKELISSWSGCDEYFQKCIARISVMMKAFQTPSKELGTMILERCQGFITEFFSVVCDQKSLVGKYARCLWDLKVATNLDTQNKSEILVSEEWGMKFYEKACILEYEISQYTLVFESLTEFSPEIKERLISSVQGVISKLQVFKLYLCKCVKSLTVPLHINHPVGADVLETCEQMLLEISTSLESLSQCLAIKSILSDKINNLRETITDFLNDFKIAESKQNPISDKMRRKFRVAANTILESILLSFQKLLKLSSPTGEISSEIQQSLALSALQCFDVEKVVRGCLLMRTIMAESVGEEYSKMFDTFASLQPLVHQYIMSTQFYLKSSVEHHRESCKLLYVLSGVFGTLAQKGFCLPSDYEEEAAEEGPELDAKAGMGLGEGETTSDAKDVSDRIESEDQLEDTMKAGESVEPADKDLNDDEKGVEMGEDFEGKQQEKQQKNQDDDDNSDKSEGDEEDLNKQMGDIDGENEDVLDDQMWGGSSDEEDEDVNEDNKKDKGVPQNDQTELAPKDSDKKENESSEEPNKNSNEQEKEQLKDYNEMDEGEINDDQVDPYHGRNEPEEEAEPMDLPEDLQLDDGEAKDDETQEENPFDLDANDREDFEDVPENPEETETEKNETDQMEISDQEDGEDEDEASNLNVEHPDQGNNDESVENNDVTVPDEAMEVMENEEPEVPEPEDTEGSKSTETPETNDTTEPSKDAASEPNVQASEKKDKTSNEENAMKQSVEEEQANSNENNASGQVESEEGSVQEGQSLNKEQNLSSKSNKKDDATRKPGETDSDRSLATEQTKNRLKTVNDLDKEKEADESQGVENDETEKEAEAYQHIKSAEKSDALTVDNATQEQAENQPKALSEEERSEELPAMEDEVEEQKKDDENELDDLDDVALEKNKPDLIKGLPQEKKRPKKNQTPEDQLDEEKMEIEGETRVTYGVQRSAESVFHTQLQLLEEDHPEAFGEENVTNLITPKVISLEDMSSMNEWHELDRKTMSLSQELCEQLRLILEPTQASRLKGDYKTGKRLNMRKVIPYIASGFRKDKIWLRRTQPSKREYQILLALDDSASMCDNQSKQMAFSAVAVVARALALLEAGQLAVASFGEDAQLLHPFEEPFTDFSGARLMKQFTFAQRRTRIIQLMEYTSALFSQARQSSGNSSAPVETAQLLLIVSDGRAVCHEGSDVVKKAVRKAREQNIFIVFVIVDNPENQYSILDIQQPVFSAGNSVQFVKYMDNFPFPFYLILRDLSALPSVLSDALRQWFELVTSSNR